MKVSNTVEELKVWIKYYCRQVRDDEAIFVPCLHVVKFPFNEHVILGVFGSEFNITNLNSINTLIDELKPERKEEMVKWTLPGLKLGSKVMIPTKTQFDGKILNMLKLVEQPQRVNISIGLPKQSLSLKWAPVSQKLELSYFVGGWPSFHFIAPIETHLVFIPSHFRFELYKKLLEEVF